VPIELNSSLKVYKLRVSKIRDGAIQFKNSMQFKQLWVSGIELSTDPRENTYIAFHIFGCWWWSIAILVHAIEKSFIWYEEQCIGEHIVELFVTIPP